MTEYKRVFVDTAPLIYLLEQNLSYYDRLEKAFSSWYESGTEVITSAITVEEYCVFPYRENRMDLIENFESFLEGFGVDVFAIDEEIAKKAAWIRGHYPSLKAMDSIQVAVAELNNCDCFLTNDKQLRQYSSLNCMIVDEMT